MKNTIVTLTAFFFHTALLHAQHCPWDGLSAIIVDVRNSTGQQVDGLDVFLADSAGTAYKSIWNRTKSKGLAIFRDTDTLIFGKNSKMQMNADTSSSALFPFAEGMYMLVVYPGNYRNGTKQVKM